MSKLPSGPVYAVAAGLLAALLLQLAARPATAQSEDCGGASIVIEGADLSVFSLPADGGATLHVQPDSVLLVSAQDPNVPPAGRQVRLNVVGLGFDSEGVSRDVPPAPGAEPIELDVGDVLPSIVRGLYQIEGTLIDDGAERCSVIFNLRVGDFGGPVATAAVATAGVAGVAALASVPLTSNGMNAKLKLKVQLRRRRPTGWRRFIPTPAWKRTMVSTLIGAVTGLASTILLQQAGVTPLSLATMVWGLVTGGGVTFGVGYSAGALRTFLSPPEVPEEGSQSEEAHQARLNRTAYTLGYSWVMRHLRL
jgi:hypothetical protein